MKGKRKQNLPKASEEKKKRQRISRFYKEGSKGAIRINV